MGTDDSMVVTRGQSWGKEAVKDKRATYMVMEGYLTLSDRHTSNNVL